MNDSIFNANTPYNQEELARSMSISFAKKITQGENITPPTVLSLAHANNSLRQDLLDSYHKNIPGNSYGYISNDIKYIQASLLEGFVFAYHKGGSKIGLYTANREFFSREVNALVELDTDAISERNSRGIIGAKRLNITYTSPTKFKVGITKLEMDSLVADDYVFIPMEIVPLYANMLAILLSEGKVLSVEENHNGDSTKRFVTQNARVLKGYSDNEMFSSGVSVRRYIQIGTHALYAPVVGSTSDTYGLEPVDLLRLSRVTILPSKEIRDLAPVSLGNKRQAILSSIMRALVEVYSSETAHLFNDYINLIESAIGKKEFLQKFKSLQEKEPVPDNAIMSLDAIYHLLSSFSDEELTSTWGIMKSDDSLWLNEQYLMSLMTFISSKWEEEKLPKSVREFNDVLKKGVYRVVAFKEGEKVVSYLTQNKKIATQIYSSEALSLLNGLETIQDLSNQESDSPKEVTALGLFGFRVDSGAIGIYQNFNLEEITELVQVYVYEEEVDGTYVSLW